MKHKNDKMKPTISLIALPLIFLLTVGATTTSSVGNNNTGTVSQSGSAADGGSSNASVDASRKDRTYVAPSLSAAQGTDTVQLGSLIFGSVTVSRDARTLELRRNINTVAALHQAELIDKETAKNYAEWTIEELKEETKPRKCLAVIPCGRERSLRNVFGLLW